MKKKILTLTISLVLTLSITACGGKENNENSLSKSDSAKEASTVQQATTETSAEANSPIEQEEPETEIIEEVNNPLADREAFEAGLKTFDKVSIPADMFPVYTEFGHENDREAIEWGSEFEYDEKNGYYRVESVITLLPKKFLLVNNPDPKVVQYDGLPIYITFDSQLDEETAEITIKATAEPAENAPDGVKEVVTENPVVEGQNPFLPAMQLYMQTPLNVKSILYDPGFSLEDCITAPYVAEKFLVNIGFSDDFKAKWQLTDNDTADVTCTYNVKEIVTSIVEGDYRECEIVYAPTLTYRCNALKGVSVDDETTFDIFEADLMSKIKNAVLMCATEIEEIYLPSEFGGTLVLNYDV